jgi:hypothetical protein
MYAVAVLGLLMGMVDVALRRRVYLLSRSQYHDQKRGSQLYMDRVAKYHYDLARKYEYAARYPWLSVEPDPPEPKW